MEKAFFLLLLLLLLLFLFLKIIIIIIIIIIAIMIMIINIRNSSSSHGSNQGEHYSAISATEIKVTNHVLFEGEKFCLVKVPPTTWYLIVLIIICSQLFSNSVGCKFVLTVRVHTCSPRRLGRREVSTLLV